MGEHMSPDHNGKDLLQSAMLRCFKMPSEIGSLRSVLEAGVDHAMEVLTQQDAQFVREFFANEELFKDRAAFEAALPPEKLVADLTSQKVLNARVAVNAASLIFTHSTVDAVAFDCCAAITLLDPGRCSRWVEDQPFTLGVLMNENPEGLLKRALAKKLKGLNGQSLADKSDFIYRACKPERGWKAPTSYSFDRDRLAHVDDIRHDVVHRQGVQATRRLKEGDEHFLEQTGLHFVLLAVHALGVTFDPDELAREVASSRTAAP
jgi:hypothetical protein